MDTVKIITLIVAAIVYLITYIGTLNIIRKEISNESYIVDFII